MKIIKNNNIKLNAGPLSMMYQPSNTFFRQITFNDIEVLRGIYFTLRDHRWNTIDSNINNLSIDKNEKYFQLNSEVSFKNKKIHFDINLIIVGNNDGSINYTFEGKYKNNFKKIE